jgi:serine/threonine protein kinase
LEVGDTHTEPTLEEGRTTWNMVSGQMDALFRRWKSAESPPRLEEFLPVGSPSLRRLALAELIKVDMDCRWARKLPRRVEDYLAEYPELSGPGGAPCDLIVEEFRVRRRAGEPVQAGEFLERFPSLATELARALDASVAATAPAGECMERVHEIQAGQRLDDFDLLALVGEGGFARVFLARQRSMQRLVALKVSPDRGDEPQTLAQLDHPHIVRVYDQRVLPDRGLRLLYMPYLPGGTLHDVLRFVKQMPGTVRSGEVLLQSVDSALAKRGDVPPVDALLRQRASAMSWPETVCWLGARLSEALEYAHGRGVLHRDIKPANVLLGADAAPRLADFNVSVCSKLEGASPAAFFGGSVGYMSPEQLEAFNPVHSRPPDSLDGRADLYSLAVTLWELLTGNRPFPEETMTGDWPTTLAAMCERRRARVDAKALAQLPPDLPPGLREVLLKCLEPDRGQRFASAGELARQFDLCLKPRTHRLLFPEPGWRTWVRRNPLLAIYPTGLIPNLLASWFSIVYNDAEIISQFPAAGTMFRRLQLITNATFFPLGIILFALLAWPVARGLRRLQAGPLPPDQLAKLRWQTLRLGPGSVAVCLWAWIAAGIIFPVTLHLTVQELPLRLHFHFLASQTLCGLIAVSYPFFGVTFLSIRALFPAFISGAALSSEEAGRLRRLDRALNFCLVIAASVPMLAVGLLAVIQSGSYLALGVLSTVGLIGFGLAYALTTAIRADLNALRELER